MPRLTWCAMAKASEGGTKVILAALLSNSGIAAAKFIAASLTGSSAMLAEAVHSIADTANQLLLLLGMRLAKKSDPERYPFGRHREVYFWAFVVALLLFSLGGVHAMYCGIEKLRSGHEEAAPILPSLLVLAVSIALEASSFVVAFREFRRSARGGGFLRALFGGKDPTVAVVVLEDTGALIGLAIALLSVLGSYLTGSMAADAIGSIAIGLLLCGVGASLARQTHSLLIGEAATPEVRRRAREVAESIDGVGSVTQMLSMHLGPDAVLLAMKLRFRPEMQVEHVERATDAVEAAIRRELPEMKMIFVEADSHYDETCDPAMRPQRLAGQTNT